MFRLYFWEIVKEKEINLYDNLFFGNEEGEFIGVEYFENGEIYFEICNIVI